MSGGVDSSVAAHLLRQAGHEVIGVFMRHGITPEVAAAAGGSSLLPVLSEPKEHKQGCCTSADAADARRVTEMLEIPFYALNFEEHFGQIIDYFVREYTVARTPNPCVMCNNWVKFGHLFSYADDIGADFVATGHYARLIPGDPPALCRGRDAEKDQSYVLFGIERDRLDRLLFPVGECLKPEIREIARELGLRVAEKKDSQEICFVQHGHHAEFVRRWRGGEADTSGQIVTTDGRAVGEHAGIEGFTIGQRKGLGVAMGEPYFVIRIEAESKQVVIGRKEELGRTTFHASEVSWLADPPAEEFACQVQIRYNSRPVDASLTLLPEKRIRVDLDHQRNAVSPGQAVVCYLGERVLGGGWIE